ncbi:FAD-dependent monooxygenase [Aureimonas pseudogalii]|uniref:Salicylate hydroxylase n=1 Tax=Aureimonas pseudogalii TaxID=1744844 RepID=A0A7W6H4F4_9HYPH|nr:FAD-dependent monooxygenase [Aureimonas pseudogalii]MBB3998312.1 salicylate hydroxylase [Aureimonas pseudogalii]
MADALRPRALIAGAGIAGLAAALALDKVGYRVAVFERARELEEVGAGLQLSPNAIRALEALGLAAELQSVGVAARDVTLRSGRTGAVLARIPVEASDGTGYRSLHRAALQAMLLRAVRSRETIDLRLGAGLVDLTETERGVDLRFDGGEPETASLFVAADGVHSRAASRLGLKPPRHTGATALRYLVRRPVEPTSPGIEAWLGPRRHAVSYPLGDGESCNLVLIQPEAQPDAKGFQNWNAELRAGIDAGTALGTWPILTVDARERMMPRRHVVFVGDAAHAMAPYAAQGAAMALEDAVVLAACVSSGVPLPASLSRFADLRRPRIARVMRRVAFHRLVYHLPTPLSLARDLALAQRSPTSLRADLAWLYDWMPPRLAPLRD